MNTGNPAIGDSKIPLNAGITHIKRVDRSSGVIDSKSNQLSGDKSHINITYVRTYILKHQHH